MSGFKKLIVTAFIQAAAISFCYGQQIPDDGLPHKIGGDQCGDSFQGRNNMLQGSLNVAGLPATSKKPLISVAVYGDGGFIHRQNVSNGSTFVFNCLPNQVSLAIEVNSIKVQDVQVGFLQPPPFVNRQDVTVTIPAASADKPVNGVVAAESLYQRTSENQALFDKAVEAAGRNKPDKAIDLLKQVVANDPKDTVAWTQLGIFAFNKGAYDDAAADYEKALDLDAAYMPAVLGAGRSEIAARKFDKAIEILKKAYDRSPDSADVNHYLGEAYLQDRKGSLAIVHMRKAMEIEPIKKADLYLRIGALYNAAGAKQLAAEEYKMLLKAVPDHPQKAALEKYIKENSPPSSK